ncbi:Hypothetical protein NTJ_01867 [Nesidiocoris tenuis]|uniref:Uncharacterized protein n=1 Tax=Nesidiocoris tenuis TaxID=355587 RepID=A0ABN7AA01_9HEMI|nr:Hypothetical protein NTJ_01867 [Nesidiocoris tenuis]
MNQFSADLLAQIGRGWRSDQLWWRPQKSAVPRSRPSHLPVIEIDDPPELRPWQSTPGAKIGQRFADVGSFPS